MIMAHKKRYSVNLNFIIPAIFTGMALLATIITYNIAMFYIKKGVDPYWPVFFGASFNLIAAFLCGLAIVKLLIAPVEQFTQKTKKLGIISDQGEKFLPNKNEMSRFTEVFNQVSEILGKVEAQRLFPQIIGESEIIRGILKQVIKVAATDSTVLILGETGTGKELVAKNIFKHSSRAKMPFVAINCAAIPVGLMESELFGHEKGAFTGADKKQLGKFEIAHNGTLFLDEVGDMPLEIQAKLLRVLQDGLIEPLGGGKPKKVNVRVIAATNQNLAEIVEKKLFREDLFYRLNVFPINIPPLRKRKTDIPLFVERFLNQIERQVQISPESMQLLINYDWPGNVRELQNVIESASVMANECIEQIHLPPNITAHSPWPVVIDSILDNKMNLDKHMQIVEKQFIIRALTKTGGIQSKASEILGIKQRSLWHRIKKYEINVPKIKANLN